jgi:hypothetical protein
MNTNAPPMTKEDEDQLSLLAVLYYVYAAMIALAALVFCGISLVGLVFAGGAHSVHGAPKEAWIVGGVLLAVFGGVGILLAAKTALMVLAGRALQNRTSHTLIMVAACLALMNIPFGTALGIFTIIVLQRESVKARFNQRFVDPAL